MATAVNLFLIASVPCLIIWAFIETRAGFGQSAPRTLDYDYDGMNVEVSKVADRRIIASGIVLIEDLRFVLRAAPFILFVGGVLFIVDRSLSNSLP